MKFLFDLILAVLCFGPAVSCLWAGDVIGSDSKIMVTFSSGWVSEPSDDADLVLKVSRGRSHLSFTKLNQDLGDYYLQSRIKEEIDSLRAKSVSVPGDIARVSIRGTASLFHISYRASGSVQRIGFFTYNGGSYAISGSGIGDQEFADILYTIRAPGEIAEAPKRPVAARKTVRDKRMRSEEIQPAIETS